MVNQPTQRQGPFSNTQGGRTFFLHRIHHVQWFTCKMEMGCINATCQNYTKSITGVDWSSPDDIFSKLIMILSMCVTYFRYFTILHFRVKLSWRWPTELQKKLKSVLDRNKRVYFIAPWLDSVQLFSEVEKEHSTKVKKGGGGQKKIIIDLP